jgi:endo-1,4-beta-xylanase
MPSGQIGSGQLPVALTRREIIRDGALAIGSLGLSGLAGVAPAAEAAGLAAAWRDAFRIGVAVSNQTLDNQIAADLDLIAREFNSVTAENAMKWGVIRPDGVNWKWDRADRLVEFAARRGMYVLGHTLVWHSQVPASVFNGADGSRLSRDALLGRMQEHIATLVGRYKGRVQAWDVVNEAVDEGNGWRRSPWLQIIGEDFMEQAFRYARAADPAAKLLYNDYNMHNPQKRAFLVKVLRDYLDRGVPIDGVGLQGHLGLDYPDLEEWERSIAAYVAMGLEIHVTELDIDVLPSPYQQSAEISNRFAYSPENDPWPQGLPDAVQEKLADRYEQVFRILLRYRKNVKRVTFWGLHDGVSWKNDFPIRGRTNYPLLLDRNMKPKPAHRRLMTLGRNEA